MNRIFKDGKYTVQITAASFKDTKEDELIFVTMVVVLPNAESLAWSPERIKAFQMDDSLVGTTRTIDDAPYTIQFQNSELNDQPGQMFNNVHFGDRATYACDKDGSIRTALKFTVERTDSNAVFLAQMFNRPITAEFEPVQMDAFKKSA